MPEPSSLSRDISPPPRRGNSSVHLTRAAHIHHKENYPISSERNETGQERIVDAAPTLAAIEAGEAAIRNHLAYFTKHFRETARPDYSPQLSIVNFQALYERNQHRHGHHFVVHQHDHPISGVHYDLRLQCSDTSTVSWAIPYGLPGNANSRRPNRMCIETRVHNLWNNLIESASHSTGSLLIWDTGEYEMLPWKEDKTRLTDDEHSEGQATMLKADSTPQSERLRAAFRRKRIRLRLHGSRLPPNYTVSLWLSTSNDRDGQPRKPKRKRRRVVPAPVTKQEAAASSDSDDQIETARAEERGDVDTEEDKNGAGVASDDDEDATIRANNAYPGAVNTVGSIHQRNWFMTLDKRNSGFRKTRGGSGEGRWVGGWAPFSVRGRDYERSVITGRSADEVMLDEGVEQFVGRKMWRPILE